MKLVILILILTINSLTATQLSCSDIKTTYNDKQCCTNNNVDTCLRSLPKCTDTNVVYGQICTDSNGDAFVKGLQDAFDFSNANSIILKKHIIPDTNAAYDLGNAEYKIRYLFESDN